jgi:hypothetical protein
VLALELLDAEGHEAVVEVLAAQVGVAGRGLDLEDAVVDGEERHEERHIEVVSVDFVIHANLLGDAVVDCFLLDEFKKSIGNTSSAMLW